MPLSSDIAIMQLENLVNIIYRELLKVEFWYVTNYLGSMFGWCG